MILTLASIGTLATAQSVEPRIARDREFREGAWLEPDLQRGAELYDHETDPQEITNLADKPEIAGVVKEMKGRLAEVLANLK